MSEDKPKPSTTYGAAAPGDLSDDTCPSCGVSVPKGYVKCPKCNAAMPRTPSPLRRAHTEPGGGTSVSASRTGAMGLVLLVAAATALVVFLANREDATPQARAPSVVIDSAGDAVGDVDTEGAEGEAVALDAGVDTVDISTIPLDSLYETLAKAELFAWVDTAPDDRTTVVLRSWYCDNQDLEEAVQAASTELLNNGFTRVICLERGGKQVFEVELR